MMPMLSFYFFIDTQILCQNLGIHGERKHVKFVTISGNNESINKNSFLILKYSMGK